MSEVNSNQCDLLVAMLQAVLAWLQRMHMQPGCDHRGSTSATLSLSLEREREREREKERSKLISSYICCQPGRDRDSRRILPACPT